MKSTARTRWAPAVVIRLATSFAERRLHLGYRQADIAHAHSPFGRLGRRWGGHEFHYASIIREGAAACLFRVRDALGEDLGEAGLRAGSVSGSYMHIIDLAG